MTASYSASCRFTLQAPGDNPNAWGTVLNNGVFSRVDDAIAGFVSIAITGAYALTTANGAVDQARMAHVEFTGTLSANAAITLPSVSKSYWFRNATNYALTITTGAGNTVRIDAGDTTRVWCDGSNVRTITFGALDLKSYIAAQVLAATGTLPGAVGNEGKALMVRSGVWTASQMQTADLGDYLTAIIGKQVALSVAL